MKHEKQVWYFFTKVEEKLIKDFAKTNNPLWNQGNIPSSEKLHKFYNTICLTIKKKYHLDPDIEPHSFYMYEVFIFFLTKLIELSPDLKNKLEESSIELLRWLLKQKREENIQAEIEKNKKFKEASKNQITELLIQLKEDKEILADEYSKIIDFYLYDYRNCIFTIPFVLSCIEYWKQHIYSNFTVPFNINISSYSFFYRTFIREHGETVLLNNDKFNLEDKYWIDELFIFHSITACFFLSFNNWRENLDDFIIKINSPLSYLLRILLYRIIHLELSSFPVNRKISEINKSKDFKSSIPGYDKEQFVKYPLDESLLDSLKIRDHTLDLVYNINSVKTDYSTKYPTFQEFIEEYESLTKKYILSYLGKFKTRIPNDWLLNDMIHDILSDATIIMFSRYQFRLSNGIRSQIYRNKKLITELTNLIKNLIYQSEQENYGGENFSENYFEEYFGIQTETRVSQKKHWKTLVNFFNTNIPDEHQSNFLEIGNITDNEGRISLLDIRNKIKDLVQNNLIENAVLLNFDRFYLSPDFIEIPANLNVPESQSTIENLFKIKYENFIKEGFSWDDLNIKLQDIYEFIGLPYKKDVLLNYLNFNGKNILASKPNLKILCTYLIGFPENLTDNEKHLEKGNNYSELAKHLGISLKQLKFAIFQLFELYKEEN